MYNVRRKVLTEGQQPLRERLFKYIEWIVDDACERARVDGHRPVDDWDIAGLLEDLRLVFASRRDQWLNESGREMSEFPHFLPGVAAEDIKQALKDKAPMPLQTGLPGLESPPEMVQAAIRGVEVVDMRPPGGAEPANVIDTEPEAAENAVIERVERRMHAPKGLKSLETSGNRGINAGEARMLRTYLSESAIALYLDRFARLNQNYDRADLEAVERIWILRAIDERWQRHLVEMQVLRNSVNVRAYGQLDPMEEYRIDGARAFVDMVRDLRRKTVANVFFFVGSAVEPTLDFEEVANEEDATAVADPAAAARAEATARVGVPGRVAMSEFLAEEEEERDREEVLVAAAEAAKRVMEMQQELIDEETDEKKESESDEEDK